MKNFMIPLPIPYKNFIFILMVICGPMLQSLGAVEPDGLLYAQQAGERNAAYNIKSLQLAEKIAAVVDDKEKQNLLLQQQLLTKLQEFPDKPEQPSIDLRFSKLVSKKTLSWQEVDQYLEHYISMMKERKLSTRNLKNTDEQMQALYNQLIALDENSPEQHTLQLQHALLVRKFNHQAEIVKQLKRGLETAKKLFPTILERTHLDQQKVYDQDQVLDRAKENLQRLEDEKNQAAAGADVQIQQQESVLVGYLGQELTDDEKKSCIMNSLSCSSYRSSSSLRITGYSKP